MSQNNERGARVLHVFDNILPQKDAEPRSPEERSRLWVYREMARAVAKKLARAPFSVHSWAALRRTLMASFLPDNILFRYKAYQRGECNRCGLCCKIQFQCPFFVDEGPYNTHCSIYTTPQAPSACVKFPLDPTDLKLLQREVGNACTFYYDGEPQRLSILEFVKLYSEGVRAQFSKRGFKEATDGGD